MAKFLEARFTQDRDGTLIMQRPYELERMTIEGCYARGYRQLERGSWHGQTLSASMMAFLCLGILAANCAPSNSRHSNP